MFVPMALLIDLHQVYEKSIEVGHRLEVLAQVYGKSMFKDLNSPVVSVNLPVRSQPAPSAQNGEIRARFLRFLWSGPRVAVKGRGWPGRGRAARAAAAGRRAGRSGSGAGGRRSASW